MNRLTAADGLAWVGVPLAAVASGAGILIGDVYRDAPYWVQQARGTDVATLFLAVPLLAIGLLTARKSTVARAAVMGVLLYLVYNYAIFAFAVSMNALSGLYIVLLGLAVWSVALSLTSREPAPPVVGFPRRLTAITLIVTAFLFGLLWLGQLAEATLTGTIPVDVERAGLPTNPVYALDLGLFLPLCLVAGIGLLRHEPAASAFALPILIWLALTSAGIVSGFWFTAQTGEIVPLPVVALVGVIGIATAVLGATALRDGALRDGALRDERLQPSEAPQRGV